MPSLNSIYFRIQTCKKIKQANRETTCIKKLLSERGLKFLFQGKLHLQINHRIQVMVGRC